MTDATKLAECPFCHSLAASLERQLSPLGRFFVECCDCEARGPYKPLQAEAIAAWNERPGEAAATKQALERAANTRPARSRGKPPSGTWGGEYQCGWDDAVVACSTAILALIPETNDG